MGRGFESLQAYHVFFLRGQLGHGLVHERRGSVPELTQQSRLSFCAAVAAAWQMLTPYPPLQYANAFESEALKRLYVTALVACVDFTSGLNYSASGG